MTTNQTPSLKTQPMIDAEVTLSALFYEEFDMSFKHENMELTFLSKEEVPMHARNRVEKRVAADTKQSYTVKWEIVKNVSPEVGEATTKNKES